MENGRRSGSRPASLVDRDTASNSSIGKSATSTVKLEPVPPTPAYDASALLIQPSPLMTSSLHSRNSATTAQESAYLRKAKFLRWTRAGLSAMIIAVAIAAIGCEGHILHRYNSTRPGSQYHLPPLWPVNIDLRPTLAILISSVIIVLASMVYLILSFIPTPYSRTLFYNILFLGTTLSTLILTLTILPFAHLLTPFKSSHQRESLQSWTCKFTHGAADFTSATKSLQIPVYLTSGMPVPAGFTRLCHESEAGKGLVAALLGLSVIGCAVAVAGLVIERGMNRKRGLRYDGDVKEKVGLA